MANFLEVELALNKINLMTNKKVVEFEEKNKKIIIHLEDGEKVKSDIVILSMGVVPDTAFLKDSGIQLGAKGHILVNDNLETNIKGIYAAGDSILVKNYITGEKSAIPLAGQPIDKEE